MHGDTLQARGRCLALTEENASVKQWLTIGLPVYNIGIMSDKELICFRLDDGQKGRIKDAASIQGKTVTTFIKEAVMNAVVQFESRPPKRPKPHTGVPAYFRALCQEATQGGSFGFRAVGYQFARTIASQIPHAQDFDEWQDELNALGEIILAPTRTLEPSALIRRHTMTEAVWTWFTKNYPNAMRLIPARRRDQFLLGVYDAAADESITLDV